MIEIAHVLRKLETSAWGGTETHVSEICARLTAHGVAGRVLAPGRGVDGERLGGAPVERYHAWCPYLGSASAREGLRATGGNLVSLDLPGKLLASGADVIHAHTGRRIGGAAALAASLRRRPFVLSVHGPLLADADVAAAETQRRSEGALDVGQAFGWLVGARRVLERADRVICFNEPERKALAARAGVRAVRMDHGVDAGRLRGGDAQRARQRWPELGAGPVVTVLGRLCRQKNQLLALRSFARGAPSGATLALAGAETDGGYRAQIEAEARALGVRGRVWLAGNLDPAVEVPDLLAASSAVLVPSTHEAFGIVVVEAWSAGVPTLFARTSGTAELATEQGVPELSLEPRGVEAWGAALARALSDEGLRGRAAAAGLALVERRFAWSRVASSLAALYREVLEERAGGSRRAA